MTISHTLKGAGHIAKAASRLGRKPVQLTDIIRARTESSVTTMPCRQALFDEVQFDRILRVPRTTISTQVLRLMQVRQRYHDAVYHDFGPAYVLGGEVFSAKTHLSIPTSLPRRRLTSVEEINEPVVLTNSAAGMRYFGHWVRDDCSGFEAAQADGRGRLLSIKRPDWPDIPFYEDAFQQSWVEKQAFYTPDLSIITDMGFGPDKIDRLESFRTRLRAKIAATDPGRIVFLRRGPSGRSRDIVNEDALIAELEARDVAIVQAEIETPALLGQLMDAAMVITVEGSQTNHALFTIAKTGALLVLQPPRRFYNPHLEWTRMFDIPYGIVIGEDRPGGFHIYPDEVLTMMDRLLADAG